MPRMARLHFVSSDLAGRRAASFEVPLEYATGVDC
jgi:hypothetical protein